MKDRQDPKEFFKARVEKGNRRAFLEFLKTGPGEPLSEGDELPTSVRVEPPRSGSDTE
jgi:hypothetical protein